MTRWRKTIRIKQFLSDDGSDANAREVAGRVADVLKRQREYTTLDRRDFDDEYSDLADEFSDLAASNDGTCEDFNALLMYLYDWADANRVWIDGERGVAA
jgi:hypothetical protein